MKLGLKGISNLEIFQFAQSLGFEEVSFDLRPKSFNFTQGYKIKEILEQVSGETKTFLQFEKEKEFVIQELMKDLSQVSPLSIGLEIEAPDDLQAINDLGFIFHLKYDQSQKLSELKACEQLKRLVFTQSFLDELNQNGELFGFFDLLRTETNFELEVLTDWDSSLTFSLLDTFKIDVLSWEINNKVEKSYRCVDFDLLEAHMRRIGMENENANIDK